MTQNQTPTDEEIDHAAAILARLEPGYLPQPLFNEISRLHVTSCVVIVPLRNNGGKTEVLLVQREPDDPVWPSAWHLPGVILRPSDKTGTYADAFARIIAGELRGTEMRDEPTFMRLVFASTQRGHELTQVYFVAVAGEPKAGQFFPVNDLPTPILGHELPYIKEAAEKFTHQA